MGNGWKAACWEKKEVLVSHHAQMDRNRQRRRAVHLARDRKQFIELMADLQ